MVEILTCELLATLCELCLPLTRSSDYLGGCLLSFLSLFLLLGLSAFSSYCLGVLLHFLLLKYRVPALSHFLIYLLRPFVYGFIFIHELVMLG